MNTDMAMITDTPITREETAMLYVGSVQAIADIVKKFGDEIHEFFAEQTSQFANTLSMMVDRNERLVTKIENYIDNDQKVSADTLKEFRGYVSDQKTFMDKCVKQQEASSVLMEKSLKQTASRMDEYQKENISAIKNFVNGISFQKGASSQYTESMTPEVVRPVLDKSSLKSWKQDVWRILNALAPKYGVGAPMVCSYVYQKMYSKFGIDVNTLYANRKNRERDTSKMLMCMHDARLGQQFEEALLDLYCEAMKKTSDANAAPESRTKNEMPESLVVQRIPPEMKKVIQSLYPGLPVSSAVRRVYLKMEQMSGLNLSDYIERNKSKIKYKSFGKSYFISKDKMLSTLFNRAVKELKEG
jgi:hypothetical protein